MREVTISVKLDDTGSDGAFKRLTARFNELGDVSDRALKGIGSKLENQLIVGLNKGGNREYLETIRRIAPEIKTLHEQIKAGSFDVADYNRRMAMMPGFVRTAMQDVKGLGEAFKQNGKDIESSNNELSKTLIGLNLLERAVDFVKQKISEGRDEFLKFGKEISAIGTIVDDDFDLSKARDQIASLPAALGKSSELANAFKLAVGSGVEAGKALAFTADSAKAAKAGFAGVTETVDASTTILNSYGIQAERVNTVYDMMFQTVKNGKIEFPQLAQSIGQVSNIAAQSGVKLEEMFAVIATATATTKPSVAIEAFRSALSNILKPSQEAAKLAESLGLQFNVSALRAKGFASFLQDVIDKTKGNTDQLAILFGDVQGLNSILSITGAQAQNFSKNLNDMSNASGNVDKAFQKQQQSLSAQIENFGVTFEKRFGTLLSVVEPVLIAIFSAINKYPNAFTAAALVVGALVTAHLLLNTQLVVTASTAIPNLIRGLITTISTMTSFTAATAAGTAGIVAFTAGWGLIVAAIGVAAYALYNYSQSQKQTVEDQLKGIEAAKAQVDSLNQQKQTLSNLQSGVGDLSNSQQQLTDIYATLSSASLDRVNAATKEKGAVSALADEIERLNKAKGVELEVQVIALVDRAAKAYEEQKIAVARAEEATKTYQNAIGNLTPVMEVNAKTGLETGRVITTVKEQYDQLGVRQNQTAEEARKATENFNNLKTALDFTKRSTGATVVEFINAKTATGQLQQQSADFLQTLSVTGAAQDTFANRTQNATGTIDKQTLAVKSLRDQLKGLTSDTQARIDEKVSAMAILAKDKAEAKRQAEFFKKYDADLQRDLKETKRLTENEKTIRDILQPADRSTSTRSTRSRAANSIDELLPSRGYGFTTYGRSGNDQYGTRQMIQNIEEVGRAWAKVSNTVIQIGDISRKGGGAFAPHETHRTGDMADIRPFRKDGKLLPTNIGDAQYDRETTRQFVLLIKKMLPGANVLFNDPQLIREGLTKYAKGHDNHLHVNRLGSQKSTEFQGLQDYERSLQDQSEKLTKDFNDAQTKSLIQTARDLKIMPEADTLRDFNRILIEEARKTGLRQPTLEETAKEFKNFNRLQGVSDEVTTRTTLATKRDQRFSDLRESLDLNNRQKDLDERRLYLADEINIRAEDYRLGLQEQLTETQVEAALLAKRNIAIETSVEFEKQRNAQIREIGDIERDFGVLRAQNANAEFVNERRKLAASREQYSLEKQITELQDELANQGLNDNLKIQLAYLQDVISLRNRELDAVIAINRAELEMSKSMEVSNNQIRARVYEHLAQQKTLNEAIADGIIGTYEAVADQAGKALDRLNEKTKGFLSFIIEPAKAIQRNVLSNITKNIVDAVFPGFGDELTKTNNPIARPIVDEQKKTNKILERIANVFGAGKGVSGLGSLGIPGLGGSGGAGGLGTIFGGNAGGGIFNFGGSGNYGTRTGDIVDGAMQIFAGDKGRDNIFSNLKNFFSGKKGGIFGKEGFGNNDGTYGFIGMAASLLGNAIGGRVGGFISGAGSGLAMGASIGTMIMPGIGTAVGAAIGAIAGGLMSLFGGDPKRKKDKNENLPKLQQGMTDSFKEFQQLVEDLKFLRINGEGAITKARELRTQIANGFGVQFESKKYKKEAQKIISSKLLEIDRRNEADPTQGGLMQQVEYYAELAKGAENRNKRIVAEFATGVYMDRAFMAQYGDYKRRNGMLPGTFTGKDSIRALLAEGEMVLNPAQIRQVIQNSRSSQDDPFKGANIPGYADGVYVSPSPKSSPSASPALFPSQPIILQPQFILRVEEGMTFDERTKVYLESDSGKRVQVEVQKTLKKEGKI